MHRVTLFHWNLAEGEERAARLRALGYDADLRTKVVPEDLKILSADAVVIDLDRQPSHGREVAGALRRRKSTRLVPIVFVGGDPGKVATVQALLPDARYTEWTRIASVLQHAISEKPGEVVVPGAMAGYSGTPLLKKLGIKAGSVVALLRAPEHFDQTLGELPAGARLARADAGVVLLFVRSGAELNRGFPVAAKALAEKGRIWIVWPKKSSAAAAGIGATQIRAHGLENGFVDFKICAVDETWSGLCFARRK